MHYLRRNEDVNMKCDDINPKNKLLLVKGIQKKFDGVHALKDGFLAVERGEICGLVGENGAGKSTLINIIIGMLHADYGEIYLDGVKTKIDTPTKARLMGIEIVPQEINLFSDLSVVENIVMPAMTIKNGIPYNKKANFKKTASLISEVNLGHYIDVKKTVSELSSAEKQLVQVYRAIFAVLNIPESKILILDEPTAALGQEESNCLHLFIKKLAREYDKGVIYVSHRLKDAIEVCDKITVFRDGSYITTVKSDQTDSDQLAAYMIGHKIEIQCINKNSFKTSDRCPALELKSFKSLRGKFGPIDISIYPGEIVGIAGLVGARRSSLLKAIFGLIQAEEGKIFINGKKVKISTPSQAIKLGIGFIPEERKSEGLILKMSVLENITLPWNLKYPGMLIQDKKERAFAVEQIKLLSIKTDRATSLVTNLSGGNQQKVVIGKWLQTKCDILLMDEPTKGIDVGTKEEVYRLLNQLTEQGKAILMVSSEMEEIIKVSHRILVMREGQVVNEYCNNVSQETLLKNAFGIK